MQVAVDGIAADRQASGFLEGQKIAADDVTACNQAFPVVTELQVAVDEYFVDMGAAADRGARQDLDLRSILRLDIVDDVHDVGSQRGLRLDFDRPIDKGFV
ncbi:MAG: hypothetical protein ACU841_04800 [Gammaproteobacteria bacterium]